MAFTRSTATTDNISTQPVKPIISAAALQALFDKYGVDDKVFINNLITELESSSSALSLGATKTSDGTPTNVQAELGRINSAITGAVLGQIPDGSLTDSKLTSSTGIFVGDNIRGTKLIGGDLNTVTKTGVYYVTSPVNQPTGTGNGYLLHQQFSGADNVWTQKYSAFNTGRIFNRENVNGTITSWVEEFNYNSNSNTTMLNPLGFQYPGVYRLTNATADLPPLVTSGNNDLWVKVDGIAESTLWRKITLVDTRTNRVWTRSIVNSVIDGYWTEEFGQAVSDVGSTNLNNWLTTKKIYGSNFTNAPNGSIQYFYVDIDGYSDTNYVKQTATEFATGRQFTRVRQAGSWFEWVETTRVKIGTSTLKTILGSNSGEWQTPSGNADYPYFAYCTVVGAVVTTTDKVNISGATLNDFALGASCGIADFTLTSAGVNTVTVYSRSLPTSNINILCEVVKG